MTTVEEDINLEYDPFTAAGVVLLILSLDCESALCTPLPPNENNLGCHSNFNGVMSSLTYAQQKSSYLVKIIANLHCFIPNICEEEERNLFLNKFHHCLRMEVSDCFRYPSKAQKAAAICENLSCLSDHATSLIPNLLNDEDVNLLRVFTDDLKKLIPPQVDDSMIQEPDVKDVKGMISKVEDLRLMHQALPNWANFSNTIYSKLDQDAQNTWRDVPSTLGRLDVCAQRESPNFKGELDHHNVTVKPEDWADDIEFDENKRKNVAKTASDAAEFIRGIEKENQKLETMVVEQNSIKGDGDLISDTRELCTAEEYAKETGLQEDEKVDGIQGEEKQPRKRKRNIMSERQINLIEKALVDEPEMQRNSASLQSWADTLSAQGSEITASQLKNWLNNRKARLARAARESRAPSEGENAYLDKTGGPSTPHFYESPDSANEEPYIPSPRTGTLGSQSIAKCSRSSVGEDQKMNPQSDLMDFSTQHRVQNRSSRAVDLKPGQLVMVVDGEGKEVGRGKVFQVEGRWQGNNLQDVGVCIVDIAELKVERSMEVQYPSEGGGRTFEEAVARNGGVARVAWDVVRVLHQLPH